jgi:hypothetical protein
VGGHTWQKVGCIGIWLSLAGRKGESYDYDTRNIRVGTFSFEMA